MGRFLNLGTALGILICLAIPFSFTNAQFGLGDLEKVVTETAQDATSEDGNITTANDIILSTTPLESGNGGGKGLETFNLGDPLYGLAELQMYDASREDYGMYYKPSGKKGTLKELFNLKKNGEIKLTVGLYYWDNTMQNFATKTIQLKADDPLVNTPKLPFAIFPEPGKQTPFGESGLNDIVSYFGWSSGHPKLEEGETNEYWVLVYATATGYDDDLVASGKIKIKNDPKAEKVYKEWFEKNRGAEASGKKLPVAAFTDPAMEKEILKAYAKCSQNSGEAVKVIFDYDEWFIDRNEITGVILDRYMDVALVIKDKLDGNYYVRHYSFKQVYVGNDFAKNFTDVQYVDEYRIAEENIK